jgi:hypothetical protein
MATGSRRLRPWRAHRLYAAPTPAQQTVAQGVKGRLIADHLGGQEPTTGQDTVLSLLACAIARHSQAVKYLATVPTPWMNRKSHTPWQVLSDMRREERHIAKLIQALVDPALERKPVEVEDLATYIERKDAEKATRSEEGPQEKVEKLDKAPS